MKIKIIRLSLLGIVIIGAVLIGIFMFKASIPKEVNIKVAKGNRLYYGTVEAPCTMSFYLYMDEESSYGNSQLLKRVSISDSTGLITLDHITLTESDDQIKIGNDSYYEYELTGTWGSNTDMSFNEALLTLDYDELEPLNLSIGDVYYSYQETVSNPIRLTYFKGIMEDNILTGMCFSLSEDCVIKSIETGCPDVYANIEDSVRYQAGDECTVSVIQKGAYITNSLLLTLIVEYQGKTRHLFYGKIVCGEGGVEEYGSCKMSYA